MQDLNNVTTYPSRIWNPDNNTFEQNLNNSISSDKVTTVGVKDTNETLGFQDGTPIDVMEKAINSDLHGSIYTAPKPTFYEKFIQKPLATIGMDAFQPKFITDIKPTPERAFATSFARGVTADIIKPEFSDQEAKANPIPAMAGQLAGTVASFATLIGPLMEGMNLAKLTPFAENVIKGGLAGGLYKGVSETSNQVRDSDNPDLAKIGTAVLHDTLWWGAIGGLTGEASKPVGVALASGFGYTMAKADGASEPDALLNGGILGGFHLFASHGNQQDVRDTVVKQTQNNIADYIQAKNPLVDEQVAHQGAREIITNHAEDAIQESDQAILARDESGKPIEIGKLPNSQEEAINLKEEYLKAYSNGEFNSNRKEGSSEPQVPGSFTDGHAPELLDYLNQYLPGKAIASMSGDQRLELANGDWKELRDLSVKYESINNPGILKENPIEINPSSDKIESDANLARGGQRNAIDEVVKSKTLTAELLNKVAKQVFVTTDGEGGIKEDISNAKESGEQAKTGSTEKGINGKEEDGVHLRDIATEGVVREKVNPLTQEVNKTPEQGNFRPEEQSTEGTGQEKPRGLSSSIEEKAIHEGLVKELGDLPTYQTRDMNDIAKRVSEFINNDHELAKRIALGDAPEQDGLRAQELFTGLDIKARAEGDVETLRELGLSEKAAAMATELGQRVKALDSGDTENPVKAVRELNKTRQESFKKNNKGKDINKETENEVKVIKKEIKKARPKVEDWNSFIDSLEC